MKDISLIVAMARQNCIGIDNAMPWHIPEDFAFFKKTTLGHPIIMGRKTWDSLPKKPLPDRQNIVISRQSHPQEDGVAWVSSVTDALLLTEDKSVFIIGGAEIYKQTLAWATDLYVTEVDLDVKGDAFFPAIDPDLWQEITRETHQSVKGIHFSFVHYKKIT